MQLRTYQLTDFEAVYALWQATLGSRWPLSAPYFQRMISGAAVYRPGDHFVLEEAGRIIGFAATQTHAAGKSASLQLIMVSPAYQRQGFGRQLHDAAFEHLRGKNVAKINVAVGGAEIFWCGVPDNASGARAFFEACGWDLAYPNYDLTRDLRAYQTPDGVLERVTRAGIQLRAADAAEAPLVQAFEREHFDFWAEYFDLTAHQGRFQDIIAAWDGAKVVGSLLIENPSAAALNASAVWHNLLGDNMGMIGAVGVDEAYRERGIGLALVAYASEIQRDRGVGQCVIGWTDLLSFYGRLGYQVWQGYQLADAR
ncbi:MAG: GNAT family N-acetyltransferase [Anaerolineae bacterium]|nr:GNAT family N-acetyltransferase [Anaerolineae bacterium]